MKLTDADVDRFIATHGAEVEARYKADERTYKAVKPQLKLRQIFIAKLERAAARRRRARAARAAGRSGCGQRRGLGERRPRQDATQKDEPRRTTKKAAEAGRHADRGREGQARGRARGDRGRQAEVRRRREAAQHRRGFKANGGELGWRTADNAMLGDKAVSDAVKALKPGEMTPVITTDQRRVPRDRRGRSAKATCYDQVKHEIAKELARDVWGKEAAKRAAIAALDKARGGVGLNLDQMYEKEKTPEGPGGIDIQQIINDPNLTDEQKQQLLQMMLQQGQKSGAIVVESKDQPAAWYAQADGAASARPRGRRRRHRHRRRRPQRLGRKALAAARPLRPQARPLRPQARRLRRLARRAPAAGSGAGSAAATTPAAAPTPPAAADITPSSDVLPQFGEVEKPTVARFGPAPRSSTMSGIGSSKEAAAALFDELSPGMLAKQVYEGDGGYIVVQLISRSAAQGRRTSTRTPIGSSRSCARRARRRSSRSG